jgi:hypothetical protein
VAVLGFKNVSGTPELACVSTALAEMLTTELSAGDRLRTIPGEKIGEMKISMSLPDADSFGQETLAKIRNSLSTIRGRSRKQSFASIPNEGTS